MDVKQHAGLWIEPELPPTAAKADSLDGDIVGDDSAMPPSDKFGARADRCDDRACLHDLQERMRKLLAAGAGPKAAKPQTMVASSAPTAARHNCCRAGWPCRGCRRNRR